MPGPIPEDFIADLRHRADIVEVIRDYVPLKKQGQNYTGICPFHAEKTPSFVVSPIKQIYHCFGCGKGGNVFTFLMEKNSVTFPEAVLLLGKRYGINIPMTEISPEKAKQQSLKERYYHINELAAKFYQTMLNSAEGKQALSYLNKRSVDKDTRDKFLLGFAPPSWDQLSRFLLDNEIKEDEIITLGLAVRNQKGSLTDRFRDRVIFPITDDRGRCIGFGGRVMDNSQPKYLNSPDTPLFNKGKHLYGLHLAKNGIRKNDKAIIMEGYMDVIASHKYGIDNCIGALGTSLTTDQARLLQRYTYNAVICFDSDSAGQEAALRGMEVLQQQGCHISVITIPDAKDPDEYLQKEGKDNFSNLVITAPPLLEYKLIRLISKYDYSSINGKIQIVQQLLPDLLKVQSPVARQAFIQRLAEKLILPETAIHAEIKKNTVPDYNSSRILTHKSNKSAFEKAERSLVRIILDYPDMLEDLEKRGGKELFISPNLKEIYQINYLMRQSGHNIKANDLVSFFDNDQLKQCLTEILLEEDTFTEIERIFRDCVVLLQIEYINRKITEKTSMMVQMEKSGEVTKSLEYMAQIQDLVREKQNLTSSLRKGGNDIEK